MEATTDKEVIEIAFDRRRLDSANNAVADTKEFCAQCEVAVQESKELLRQVDDLLVRNSTKADMPR